MNQINKIRLSLKFPNTYLEYDDIESLWEYAIRNSSKLEVNYEDLDFKQDSKMEDIFASFYDIFEDDALCKNRIYIEIKVHQENNNM